MDGRLLVLGLAAHPLLHLQVGTQVNKLLLEVLDGLVRFNGGWGYSKRGIGEVRRGRGGEGAVERKKAAAHLRGAPMVSFGISLDDGNLGATVLLLLGQRLVGLRSG